jgi:inhibitor of cysteine peptidase
VANRTKLFCLLLLIVMALSPILILQSNATMEGAASKQTPVPTILPEEDIKTRLKNAVVLYVGSTQALVKNSEVQIDPGSTDVKPVVKNGRTLVPVRFISESLGAKVDWKAGSSTVIVSLNGKVVEMVIGSPTMKVGKVSAALDTPAEIIGNRTFIPLRKLVEALGKKVFYDRGLIVISDKDNVFNTASEKSLIDDVISQVNNLPVVGNFQKLKTLLADSSSNKTYIKSGVVRKAVMMDDMVRADAVPQAAQAEATNDSAGSDYSSTNIQVQGVDEADIVKTDGQYIYQVNKNRIIISKAYPAENMEIVSKINFPGNSFTPAEIYIDSKYMVVIGSNYNNVPVDYSEKKVRMDEYYQNTTRETVKAIVYDINDRANLVKIREFELDGNYVSSRKIGASLYLVSNKYAGYAADTENPQLLPAYRDTAKKDNFITIDYPEIRYFPQMVESNYMIIGGINLENMDEAAKVSTFLGAGQNIYASLENLYVTVSSYKYNVDETQKPGASTGSGSRAVAGISPQTVTQSTTVYKFSLDNSKVTYINKGEVPGTVLNQFSMDENNSYFRIATTTGEVWNDTSKNNIYVLDELLNMVGKLEDIAPGERIYSTRFMGERLYMVTFKNVDPLFVIDLKDPRTPRILGALKIPGYSDYLHPYDENHIIGFGKDTTEVGNGAYYQGMKIALFDVTDVSNPKEMFKENIGDRGTDSELLRNHKALLFSKDKNLLAFPVTLMEKKDKDNAGKDSIFEYGQFTFQGAYVYNLDLTNGFTLKGKVTHLSESDILKSGNYGYDRDSYIQRILYIGDTLYTLSNGAVKANNISDLKEIKTLQIP